MNGISLFIGNICIVLIDIITFAMFIRAILSLFMAEDNAISSFLYTITEPIILPVRRLLEKFNILQGLPIDISFLITYLLLSTLGSILSIWF